VVVHVEAGAKHPEAPGFVFALDLAPRLSRNAPTLGAIGVGLRFFEQLTLGAQLVRKLGGHDPNDDSSFAPGPGGFIHFIFPIGDQGIGIHSHLSIFTISDKSFLPWPILTLGVGYSR
jgi:hypothetical protein